VLPDAVAGQLSCFFSRKIVPVQGVYGMRFCHHGMEPIEQEVYRGTRFLDGWKFIRCTGYLNKQVRDRGIIINEIIMVPGT
jgi:hypothetical protein